VLTLPLKMKITMALLVLAGAAQGWPSKLETPNFTCELKVLDGKACTKYDDPVCEKTARHAKCDEFVEAKPIAVEDGGHKYETTLHPQQNGYCRIVPGGDCYINYPGATPCWTDFVCEFAHPNRLSVFGMCAAKEGVECDDRSRRFCHTDFECRQDGKTKKCVKKEE